VDSDPVHAWVFTAEIPESLRRFRFGSQAVVAEPAVSDSLTINFCFGEGSNCDVRCRERYLELVQFAVRITRFVLGRSMTNRLDTRHTFIIMVLAGLAPGVGTSSDGSDDVRQNQRPLSKVVYLSDLNNCQPESAISGRAKRGVWRTIDYKADTVQGSMLVATEESEAPDVTYPVKRSGWHKIYVGIYRKPFEEAKQVHVKLTDDPAFTRLEGRPGEKDHQENWIDEIFWKAVDLTGRRIILRQISLPQVRHAWVAYIKLIPLSNEQISALHADRRRSDTRRLFVHTDAHFSNVTGSRQELLKYLEPLRHTDVDRVYWEAGGGDRVLYFSKIGGDYAAPLRDTDGTNDVFFPRKIDRDWAVTWEAYHRNEVDPLRVAVEFAHDLGLELHASYRTAGFVYPPPHDDLYGQFARKHPELLCVDRDGNKLPRISYTFPETCRYVISLFRELAEYPIDGVCVLYNRRPPLVAYEAPLVAEFTALFDEDPRKLDPGNQRWLNYRSKVLTQFMRELRAELDAVAKKQKRSKRLIISAVVFRKEENLLHGMDLSTWIKEGLVDTIIPYSSSVRLNSSAPAWEQPDDIAYFLSLVKGTNCHLAPNMMPRNLTSEQYRRKAHMLYQAGVRNFFFWDGIERVRKVSRLGHQQEITDWVVDGHPPIVPTATRLRTLGKWDLSTETPG